MDSDITTDEAPRTDPTGRSFLSYRRCRLGEAELLVRAQHELGIPTWRDVEDLDAEPTEEALRSVLNDPTTANAVLWLTPEVAESATIRRVEAPEVVRRTRGDNGFFLVPVAAGGLDYEEAADQVNRELGVEDLARWNMLRTESNPVTEEEARRVAARVLRRRVDAVHQELPPEEPLRIRLMTRRRPGFEPGWALSLDWFHRFSLRTADDGAWDGVLLPALATIREALRAKAPRRPIEASGLATLPAGLAFGRAFLSLDRDLRLTWRQESSDDGDDQLWSLEAPREELPLAITTRPLRTEGEALAVLLSVTRDVERAFGNSKDSLPTFRAAVEVRREGEPFEPLTLESPGQAATFVDRTIEAVRRAAEELHTTSLHLFAAIPLGLAVLLGQRLNTLGPVHVYVHDESTQRYALDLVLPEDV